MVPQQDPKKGPWYRVWSHPLEELEVGWFKTPIKSRASKKFHLHLYIYLLKACIAECQTFSESKVGQTPTSKKCLSHRGHGKWKIHTIEGRNWKWAKLLYIRKEWPVRSLKTSFQVSQKSGKPRPKRGGWERGNKRWEEEKAGEAICGEPSAEPTSLLQIS